MKQSNNKVIDIVGINQIYFQLGVEYKNKIGHPISKIIGRSYIYGMMSFFYLFAKSLFCCRKTLIKPNDIVTTLYFGQTVNNYRALEKIFSKDKNHPFFLCKKEDFPIWKQFYYSVGSFHSTHKLIKSLSYEEKEVVKANYLTILCTPGIYRLVEEIVCLYNPKVVVMANDHSTYNRCMIDICKKLSIKTVYVQHASVTNKFPSLRFDYSFLDGLESLEKYEAQGLSQGKVFLSGGVRFDGISRKKENMHIHKIGIALNEFDDKEKATKIISYLLTHGDVSIVVRPHPARAGKSFEDWCVKLHVKYSDSKNEPSFDFLYNIDVLLANDSSIHLDAAIVGCPSLVYNFSSDATQDYYGFIKHGLVREINDEHINEIYKHTKAASLDVVRYYHASVGTAYEGQVGTLVLDLISNILGVDSTFESFVNLHAIRLLTSTLNREVYIVD